MVAPETPISALLAIIESLSAKTCLLCARSIPADFVTACEQLTCSVSVVSNDDPIAELPMQRYDLAVIADCLEHMNLENGQQLVGRLRNVHSNHLAVLVSDSAGEANADETVISRWSEADFYALGMQHYSTFKRAEKHNLQLYTYAIESYNHKRAWNNARFWANPENFNRYWW